MTRSSTSSTAATAPRCSTSRAAVRLVLLGQHRPDLPGRRAHRERSTASAPGPGTSQTVETSCTTCAVQCRGALQSSSNRLVRLLGVDSEPVNHGWLCDKGRYGIEWVHSERARARPEVRERRRARRGVVAGRARRRRRRGSQRVLDLHGPSSDRACSAARTAPTRTPTSGPGSPRASSAPTTSTRSSATACRPRSCSAAAREIADCDRAARDRAARARPQGGAAGAATCGCGAPRSSSACRSSISRRSAHALSRCAPRVGRPRPVPGRGARRRRREPRSRGAAKARDGRDRSSSSPAAVDLARVGRRDRCGRGRARRLTRRAVPVGAAPRQRARRARRRASRPASCRAG